MFGMLNAQKTEYCFELDSIISVYNRHAFSPVSPEKMDTQSVIKAYVELLDPKQFYLCEKDIKQISNYFESNNLLSGNDYCSIATSLDSIYTESLDNTLTVLKKVQYEKTDLSSLNLLLKLKEFDWEYYAVDQSKRIENSIYKKALYTVFSASTNYDSIINDDHFKINLEEEIAKTISFEEEKIKSLSQDTKETVFQNYVNSVLTSVDPHNLYLPEDVLSLFMDQLSTVSKSFGFSLEKDKYGSFKIQAIIPGSSAWKSGELNIGTKVTGLQLEGSETLELDNSTSDEISLYFESNNSDLLTLTVLDANQQKQEVLLHKEETKNEDNKVEAFILNGEQKAGYIDLPAFYTSWETDNIFGCAQDVAKAIYQLKKQNIESLIIDLRNNGGGSIKEAIELAGIFIDFGTLLVEQDNTKQLYSLKDFNRGVMYDGPIALLVNNNSASASEMTAAVLQDYNRAIVVGENTFGKASGQTLIPYNHGEVNNNSGFKNVSAIKITSSRYYRVTGKSYQNNGVRPDILLPVPSFSKVFRESDYENALGNNTITKKTYYKKLASLPSEYLKKNSSKRIMVSPGFKNIRLTDSLIHVLENSYFDKNLTLPQFISFLQARDHIIEMFDKIYDDINPSFKITNLDSNILQTQTDSYYSIINQKLIESIQTDPYIEETFLILQDYLNTLIKP